MTRALPPRMTMIARGMRKRCPACGERDVFTGWFSIRERCPTCNLRLEQGEGAFLGSMALNYAFAGIVFFVYLAVFLIVTLPDVNVFALTASSVALVTVALAFFFPFSKTLWSAIDVQLRDPDDVDFGSG